jgi:hypothetical protein
VSNLNNISVMIKFIFEIDVENICMLAYHIIVSMTQLYVVQARDLTTCGPIM